MHFCLYVWNVSIIVALTAASRGTANVCLWVCAVPELRSASSQRTFTADVAAAEYDMNLWRYACFTSQHSMQFINTLPLVLANCMDNTRRNALLDQASGLLGCHAGDESQM